MYRTILTLSIFLVTLSACGKSVSSVPRIPERGLDAGAIIVGPTAEGHVYATYGIGADRFPPPRLLFFAGNDIFSRDIDATLRSIYGSGGVVASTFRLEFGSATGARLQYGVLVPSSLVVITASGAEKPILYPTEEHLHILLYPFLPLDS